MNTRKLTKKQIENLIYRQCSEAVNGVAIPMLQISAIYRAGHDCYMATGSAAQARAAIDAVVERVKVAM